LISAASFYALPPFAVVIFNEINLYSSFTNSSSLGQLQLLGLLSLVIFGVLSRRRALQRK
jgi:hypothetical protein